MIFDEVYELLVNYQSRRDVWVVLLAKETLREIYNCILATKASDCLELGTAFGATTCVMAAAVEEIGSGMVTTVDIMGREPVGIDELAQATGLSRFIRPIVHRAGYNWYLSLVLLEQTKGRVCEPNLDFCYLDGAHEWQPDALAVLLMTKLLRPGGWMMIDDLNFKLRDCQPGWEITFADKSADELDTRQIGMAFDLLVKPHPDLEHFMLTNDGHIGWARKIANTPASWFPNGVACDTVAGAWSEAYDGAALTWDVPPMDGVFIEAQGNSVLIRSTIPDPYVVIRIPIEPLRTIDFVTFRLRLIEPDLDFLHLYWLGVDDWFFGEDRRSRCAVRSPTGTQDLTFFIRGSAQARKIRLLRVDPGEGACSMVLERMTIGGR